MRTTLDVPGRKEAVVGLRDVAGRVAVAGRTKPLGGRPPRVLGFVAVDSYPTPRMDPEIDDTLRAQLRLPPRKDD